MKSAYLLATAMTVIGLVPLTAATSPLKPAGAGNANPGVLPPNSKPLGAPYSDWSVRFWQWSIAQPIPDNPPFGGAPCTNGQSGHVWFLYGGPATVECVVPPGTALYLPVVNTECSNLEAAPFHGNTPAERAACAKAWIDNLTDVSATIDGVSVQHLSDYRIQSGDFPFCAPSNNILGVAPGCGLSSDEGYYLMLAPLSHGKHTIHIQGTFHDPFDPAHPVAGTIDTTILLTVGK